MHAVQPPVVDLAIDGRITAEAIADLAAALERALARHEHFVVVFDRRHMTAPTPRGREALTDMAGALLPRLDGRCLAWADVFDSRRFAALAASGEHGNDRTYPQRMFDDLTAAREWAVGHAVTHVTSVRVEKP